jgi:hypothetical protein
VTEEQPKLPQEDIDKIVRLLERIERRRKILIAGYAVAALVMIVGEIAALYVLGNAPPGRFMGWVFLVPFTFTGAVLWGFGRWANSLKVRPGP